MVKNLMPFFIQEKLEKGEMNGGFEAFTMFVDLSGFTPLTEELMKKGSEGAEELSIILNKVFNPMVAKVYGLGGFIPHFAGDAFSAIFRDVNPEQLVDLSKYILHLFASSDGPIIEGQEKRIGVKIGLSFGEVEWGIVGEKIKSYFFKGRGVQDSVNNSLLSERHEIIIDQLFYQRLHDQSKLATEYCENDRLRIADIGNFTEPPLTTVPNALDNAVLRAFFPDEILGHGGRGEFRNVTSIFISFKGIEGYKQINAFSTVVLNLTTQYAGYFKEIDFGDKGGLIVVFFGAPRTYENIQDRALEYVLALQGHVEELNRRFPISYRIGMTSGVAFTGLVGGEERVQYGAAGTRVNLAARLAIHSKWGSVLVDDEVHKNTNFTFSYEGEIRYKGIKDKIPTYRLIGKDDEKAPFFEGEMVGRNEELEGLCSFISDKLMKEIGGLTYVYGEAGIGKSRLAFEAKSEITKRFDVFWFICQTDQILKKPLNPFVHFLLQFFNQAQDFSQEEKLEEFETRFNDLLNLCSGNEQADVLKDELLRIKSVLAARIGIIYEDSLWNQLDGKGRLENTLSALETLVHYLSLCKPVILMIEDAHWLDELSTTLITRLVRKAATIPLILVVTSRFLDDGSKPKVVDDAILESINLPIHNLALTYLQPSAMKMYAELRLQGAVGPGLFNLLVQTTNGNPFYVEQLIQYFLDSDLLEFNEGEWRIRDKKIQLSTSVKAILMARIDRLSNMVKETVKAAAVIGREFEIPVLSEVMRAQQEFKENTGVLVQEQIRTAEREQIWRAINELKYMFRHSLLREAVYDMQLRTRLRHLHLLIGQAIENLHKNNLEDRYVDLAFHFEQADSKEKTLEYLMKSADYARKNFQNQQALIYYDKLLNHLKGKKNLSKRVKILLKKSNIHELIGDWDESEKIYRFLLQRERKKLDEFEQARIGNAYGNLLILKGDYNKAAKRLNEAAEIFERLDDSMGLSVAYGHLGNLHFRTGQYKEAKSFFTQSITLSQYHNYISTNASIVSNLGLTHMNLGEYEEGVRCLLGQLLLSNQLGDQRGTATLETNLGIIYFEKGDLESALKHYDSGLKISKALGDKLLTSIAVGCIGNVLEEKGNLNGAFAMYMQDLEICYELGDKQGLSIAYDLLAGLHCLKGEFAMAKDYADRSLKISSTLGYAKGSAKSHQTLGKVSREEGDLPAAHDRFSKSEQLGRQINNKKVLASALIDKCNVEIMDSGQLSNEANLTELSEILKTLQNENLNFKFDLLCLKQHGTREELENGERLGLEMMEKYGSMDHKAMIFDQLHQLTNNMTYKKQAVGLYRLLTREDPYYHHKMRLDALQQPENRND